MQTPPIGRPYTCIKCGQQAYTASATGRMPAYCPDCRPRVAKRGGGAGSVADTLVYRLALSTTALQLGVDRARLALLQADRDGRASSAELRRAIVAALVALDDADANRLEELTAADLLGKPAPATPSLSVRIHAE